MSLTWSEKKDPTDISWWEIDCSSFLDDDTISTATWTAPTGITKVAETNTTTAARVKLSGGTAGATYTMQLDLTTTGGQTFQRTIDLWVDQL